MVRSPTFLPRIHYLPLISSVLLPNQERTKDNSKESETFRELLAMRTAEYVEETLQPHFGGLMQFVRDAEAMVERGDAEALRREEREFDAGGGEDGMGR